MPFMTGMELHAEPLTHAAAQAERMVFMTGSAFTPQARLEKPFDTQNIRACVRGLVLSGLQAAPPTR